MRITGGLSIIAGLVVGALGVFWLVGAAAGGEWDVQTGSGWVSGWLVGAFLALLGILLVAVGARGVRGGSDVDSSR